MGILTSYLERRSSLRDPADWLVDWFGGRPTASGVTVNAETSKQETTVYACVKVLAESIASMPLILYRRQPNDDRQRATDHPLYRILHDQPNPWQTAYEWREMMVEHLALRGNAYNLIGYNRDGSVAMLFPLHPDRVRPYWISSDPPVIGWEYTLKSGATQNLIRDEVLHFRGGGSDLLRGQNPIELHRETIGLSMAAREFGARFFSNGMVASGVLEHPGKLGPEAKKLLAQQWQNLHSGLANAHKTAILEEGMKFNQLTINAKDAQFLETRKYTIPDICRIFRVPPHKVQELERATYSNIEHQSIEYVTDTLQPICVRLEQRIKIDLLTANDQESLFVEHLVDSLLRGDTTARYQAYAVGRQWGWLSANDIRKKENMNRLPDKQGDQYLVPMNMVPADRVDDMLGQPSNDTPEPDDDDQGDDQDGEQNTRPTDLERRQARSIKGRVQIRKQYERIIAEASRRGLKKEINAIRSATKTKLRGCKIIEMNEYIEKFYEEHTALIARDMVPVMLSLGEATRDAIADETGADPAAINLNLEAYVQTYAQKLAERHVGQSRAALVEALGTPENCDQANESADRIDARMTVWEQKRAGSVGLTESVRAIGAVSAAIYTAIGFAMVWRNVSDGCALCAVLEGQVVREGTFLKAGDKVDPDDGKTAPLIVEGAIGHPPLHRGCDCMVAGVRR